MRIYSCESVMLSGRRDQRRRLPNSESTTEARRCDDGTSRWHFRPGSYGTLAFKVVASRPIPMTDSHFRLIATAIVLLCTSTPYARSQTTTAPGHVVVLHAARLLDVKNGHIVKPGEVLVEGERIVEVGSGVKRPAGAEVIDLGDRTLMPGLIDAHVHLFLHPGAEDLQTVKESVAARTLYASLAAKADLLAGFTAERDMGTEGAGSADTAIRDAIDRGLLFGPRLRISGNAIDILGGHEDADGANPEQHLLSNATYANTSDELIAVIREQHKQGSDFAKIYETGHDTLRDGVLTTPYQYTAAQLKAAVDEEARLGGTVGVHAMGEPGTLYAAEAG